MAFNPSKHITSRLSSSQEVCYTLQSTCPPQCTLYLEVAYILYPLFARDHTRALNQSAFENDITSFCAGFYATQEKVVPDSMSHSEKVHVKSRTAIQSEACYAA